MSTSFHKILVLHDSFIPFIAFPLGAPLSVGVGPDNSVVSVASAIVRQDYFLSSGACEESWPRTFFRTATTVYFIDSIIESSCGPRNTHIQFRRRVTSLRTTLADFKIIQ
jgi:hypothetical protein